MNTETENSNFYKVFISYSMDPDYAVSKRIEYFLESFHKLNLAEEMRLKPINVCRDGSDFSLHKLEKEKTNTQGGKEKIRSILEGYLRKSEFLLVLCSRNAALSEYVNFEVDWFIQNKGSDKILVAVTEFIDALTDIRLAFPKAIFDHKLYTDRYYDFRGFRKEAKSFKKIKDFDEELTNLAAHLNDRAAGEILPNWRKEEILRRRSRLFTYVVTLTSILFLIVSLIAITQWRTAVENRRIANINLHEALNNLKLFQLEKFRRHIQNGSIFIDAKEYSLAYDELIGADSIAKVYPQEQVIASRLDDLGRYIQLCKPYIGGNFEVSGCMRIYNDAIKLVATGQYEVALKKLSATKLCDPKLAKQVDSITSNIFNKIDGQRQSAIRQIKGK